MDQFIADNRVEKPEARIVTKLMRATQRVHGKRFYLTMDDGESKTWLADEVANDIIQRWKPD